MIIAVAIGLVVVPVSGSSKQKDAERAETIYLEGAAFYRAGDYRAALGRFRKAYRAYPEPNLLYNIGRCHEGLGELDQASVAYKKLLAIPAASRLARDKARARIRSLEGVKHRTVHARRRPTADVAGFTRGEPPRSTGDDRGGSRLKVAKWIVGATGLALSAAGALSFVLGNGDHDKVRDAQASADPSSAIAPMTRVQAAELRDSGNLKKVIGYAMWGAGGAALVSAIVMFALDGDDREKPRRVSLSPSVGGVTISAAF